MATSQSVADYLAISAALRISARCPLLDRCERRAQTIADAAGWPMERANELAGIGEPVVAAIGDGAGRVGGTTNYASSGMCPEVNLFEPELAQPGLSGRATTRGAYDKYLNPQFEVLEIGHYSRCAEYVSAKR